LNLASFVEFDKGLLLLLPYLCMNLNETWWKDVYWWVLQLCWSKMSRQMIFKWTNYVILVIFYGFLWLFYFGAFLTMKTTFFGYISFHYLCRQYPGNSGTCFRFLVSLTVPEIFDQDVFAHIWKKAF